MAVSTARYKTSYIHTFKRASSDGVLKDMKNVAASFSGSGSHIKSKYILSWDKGDYQSSATVNYASSYEQPYKKTEVKVDRLYTLDLQFVYSGIANTKITFGVDNVTNEKAPFFDGDYQGYEISTADASGTFVYGKINYTILICCKWSRFYTVSIYFL